MNGSVCCLVSLVLGSISVGCVDSDVSAADPPPSPAPLSEAGRATPERVQAIRAASLEPAAWAADPLVGRLTEPFTGDLDGIRQREVLRVLVSYGRTNFFIAEGALRGFEVEMFRELEKRLAKERASGQPPLQIAFLPVPFDELLPALLDGHGDVAAASLTVTPEREAHVAFSEPYRSGVDEIVVANASAPPLERWEDLAGERLLVATGTAYETNLELWNERFVEAGLEPMHVVSAGRALSTEDVLELVHSGAFPYTVADRFLAELWAGVLGGLRPEPNFVVRAGGEIAWAVRPNNPKLEALLDGFARENRAGSLIGNVLFRRYYEGTQWIRNPLLDTEHSKLAPFRDAIVRASNEHGFDWRLIVAQAYQESGLVPDRRSHVGAIGLMQLLPATAADMGVTDLLDPEQNILAGVRYMDWLRSHFFDEAAIPEPARVDFCLAAYNAGPGCVRRWRAKAPERGLDPNRWFGNVELLALEDVGMEPVRYVGNINKYHVLFSMALEEVARRDEARAAAVDAR